MATFNELMQENPNIRQQYDTWRDQRIAAYRAAIANLPKTPPKVFMQLAVDTLRNKLAALLPGQSKGTA